MPSVEKGARPVGPNLLIKALSASLLMTAMTFAPLVHAEEGEGGGEKGKKASTSLPVSEWNEIEANIAALQTKVKAKQEELHELIAEKEKLSDKNPRVNEVVKAMASSYHELRAFQEDLEKQKSILRFRFPERLSEHHDSNEKIDTSQSLEKYEREVKTDQQLHRTLEKAEKVYGVEKGKADQEKPSREDPENSTPLIQK